MWFVDERLHVCRAPASKFKKLKVAPRHQLDGEIRKWMWEFKLHSTWSLPALSWGGDPEFVVMGEKGVLPAFEWLKEPVTVGGGDLPNTILHHDGFVAEITYGGRATYPYCLGRFADKTQQALVEMRDVVRRRHPTARITCESGVDVDVDSATDEELRVLCGESENLYGLAPVKVDPRKLKSRFAGCHWHLGLEKGIRKHCPAIVGVLDGIVGCASVAMLRGLEDAGRREYYGMAGEYRLPEHGLEYRVLSSALFISPVVWHAIGELIRVSYEGGLIGAELEAPTDLVIDTIQELDVKKALEVWEMNRGVIKELFSARTGRRTGLTSVGDEIKKPPTEHEKSPLFSKIETLVKKGAKEFFKPSNMERAWRLDGGWQSEGAFLNGCVKEWDGRRVL